MQSKLTYILAGAGALIAGALLFHYWSERESVSSAGNDEFMKDIEALGPIQMEKGNMKPEFFIKLMKVISKHIKTANKDKREALTQKRR
jgi:hypothetical protein